MLSTLAMLSKGSDALNALAPSKVRQPVGGTTRFRGRLPGGSGVHRGIDRFRLLDDQKKKSEIGISGVE
jgi:hypothetical protein